MLDQLAPVVRNIKEGGDIVVGAMIDKVVQTNPWNVQVRLDMLLHPARDKNPKRNEGIIIEESEHAFDEFLNLVFVVAFVQPV
ncbi:hypothetical protein EST38_g12729 [Candolleomyces aberdarensis]|uniref:Uncharacterized protein n=1 Tax=Candolleomyces aberdarensis TaxID=2316362 RepID=A0A4Q2D4P5_9AGAR|nr:hypothetical protein EST38_g12729 [Candolleomyces aberdarensis]